MKKIFMVSLMVVAVFGIVGISDSDVMVTEKGALIEKASISKGFSPASTYIMVAERPATAPLFPELLLPPPRTIGQG